MGEEIGVTGDRRVNMGVVAISACFISFSKQREPDCAIAYQKCKTINSSNPPPSNQTCPRLSNLYFCRIVEVRAIHSINVRCHLSYELAP